MRKLFLMCLIVMMNISCVLSANVSKIVSKSIYSRNYETVKLFGYQGNKKVWTWTSKKHRLTELTSVTHLVKGNKVYVFEQGRLSVLNKQSGKTILSRKTKQISYQTAGCVDTKGNIYTMGYYDSYAYKFSKKGKCLWKRAFATQYYWPTKLKVKKNLLYITFDSDGQNITKKLNTANGKIIS